MCVGGNLEEQIRAVAGGRSELKKKKISYCLPFKLEQ